MQDLDWQAWITIAVIIGIAVALLREMARPDLVFLGGLGVLLLAGVVPPDEAFAGFSNSAVLVVGALFVVAAGVQQTEALGFLDRLLFAQTTSVGQALPRLMIPTSLLSGFLNNTPIVAMLTPRVQQWARRVGLPVSKLLIPLSYAAIVGGMITLIGTSTNIVVSGLLMEAGLPGFGMFDLTWIGLPAMVGVAAFFALGGHRLLPNHDAEQDVVDEGLKDCLFEVRVSEQSALVGQTIDEAALRSLGNAYLVHIRRAKRLVPATPGEVMQGGDVLTFTGDVASLETLLRRDGLERVVESVDANDFKTLPLFEAVIADSSSLIGRTLRKAHFREEYGGVVLAIQRRNERVDGPLGRIPIKAGDLLLVEAKNGFDKRWNASRDEFYLVAPRRATQAKPQPGKAPIALLILGGMVALVTTGLVSLVTAAFTAALAMIATRCLSSGEARNAVNLQVLIVIAAALGLGKAVTATGLAGLLATGLLTATAGFSVLAVLVAIYITTNILTELITHKAAAVLMLPVALAIAASMEAEPKAFALVVTVGAAASFMTPIGYQTNLMVMAAGGYRFKDYMKVGMPVSLLVMTISVSMIYLVWL